MSLARKKYRLSAFRIWRYAAPGVLVVLAWPGQARPPEYGNVPLSFEQNQGQTARDVQFLARGDGSTLYLTCSEAVLQLTGPAKPEADSKRTDHAVDHPAQVRKGVLRMSFGASGKGCRAEGLDAQPGRANYFRGRSAQDWITQVPLYGKVRYADVYPGIDLIFYGKQGRIEYDFVVAAGADPSRIRLKIDGAERLEMDDAGGVVAALGGEQVVQHRPLVYQDTPGKPGAAPQRELVEGRWKLLAENVVGFELGNYDRDRPLLIDPVIVYSTYLGGSSVSRGFDIAVDAQGFATIVGETDSVDFPTTAGVPQSQYPGSTRSGFVVKLNRAGNQIVFASYLGGGGLDQAFSVDVDPQGNVYVAGEARGEDFPTTLGSLNPNPDGGQHVFVAKLPPDGSRLIYSTYVGNGNEDVGGIAVDDGGYVCVTGQTISTNFPLVNPIQTERRSPRDATVARLNPAGSALVFSTYYGGEGGRSLAEACAVDEARNVYITGSIEDDGNVPTTPGAFQMTSAGKRDAFLAKFSPEGSLIYSTMLGGTNSEWGHDVAVDRAGHAYVAGETDTTDFSFPIVVGAMREQARSGEGFVTKFSANGDELIYSTFVGGNGNVEPLEGIALDTAGHAYVTGFTNILSAIDTVNAIPGAEGVGTSTDYSATFTKLSVDGSKALVLTGFGGGDDIEQAHAIAVDPNCQAYITGETRSTDFVTVNPLQAHSNSEAGDFDGFVTKIDPEADNGEPAIGCRGVVAAPVTPVLREGTPNSIMTVYGSRFAPQGTQALVPNVDSNGRVSSRLADTCVEVNGVRAPVFAVYTVAPSPDQINFQNPHQIGPGYASFRVVSGCGTANERFSEPETILIRPAAPAFFNFINNGDGVNPIAAVNESTKVFVGPAGLFAAVTTAPARPGEFVSLYGTGFGATTGAFEAGQVPPLTGIARLITADVHLTIGGIEVPAEDITYIGIAPGNAGLYQLVFKIPANAPSGNLAVVLTIQGVSSPAGPFVAVQAQ